MLLHKVVGIRGRAFGVGLGFALLNQGAFAVTVLPSLPQLDNKSYVVMDYETGQVLASNQPDTQFPPASLTKMMTSFIVEQKLMAGQLKEDEPVRMSADAWCHGTSEESCMYVPVNGTATVLQMLRGIIIQSGNDASKAMAEHVAGNEGAFSDLMNAEAKRIGMTHTHFLNATGLPMDGHVSTALDMAKLARVIIHDSNKYYPIYSEKEFTFNNIKQGNRNVLLYTDPSVDGLKTGHTEQAGFCLVASSKRGPMRLITAVFGAKTAQARGDQSRDLLNWGFSQFETTPITPVNQPIAQAPVWLGAEHMVPVGLNSRLAVTLPKGQAKSVKTNIVMVPNLKAPLIQGQTVGKLVATLEGKTLAEQPLVALKPVAQGGFFSRLLDHIKMFFAKV